MIPWGLLGRKVITRPCSTLSHIKIHTRVAGVMPCRCSPFCQLTIDEKIALQRSLLMALSMDYQLTPSQRGTGGWGRQRHPPICLDSYTNKQTFKVWDTQGANVGSNGRQLRSKSQTCMAATSPPLLLASSQRIECMYVRPAHFDLPTSTC
jgi:hypothetical protein